jgi:DNA-binding NarL/FixJ family response regulator
MPAQMSPAGLVRPAGACGFIGRTTELATAEHFLAAHPTGPALIAVTGEPGIGKSRFLTALRERLTCSGWRPAPAPPRFCAGPPGEWLRPPAGGSPVLVLDDVHRLPPGTAARLAGEVLRCGPGAVRLVLGLRPGRTDGRLAAAMTAALAVVPTLRLELPPFSLAEVREFLGGYRTAAAARAAHEAGGGNPLYMAILLELAAAGEAAAVLRAEVDGLPEPHRTVTRAAAVLGDTFDAADLHPVAQLPAGDVDDAIDALVHLDVLRRAPDGRLRFRHFLLRRAVDHATGSAWRRQAHARAARLRQDRGDAVWRWAEHLRHSARAGDLTAVRHLGRGAAAMRWRSAEVAAQWYETAGGLLPDRADTRARRGRLLLSRAQALMAAGQLTAARDAAVRALELIPAHGRRVRRQALLLAARAEQAIGRFDEAAGLLRRAAEATAAEEPAAVDILLELAGTQLMRGDFGAAHRTARSVLARPAGAGGARQAAASGAIALAHYVGGRPRAAAAHADRMGRLVDASADHEIAPMLASMVWLGWADMFLGRYGAAERRQARAVALARRTRQRHALIGLLIGRGGALRYLGRLDESRECYEEAHEAAKASGSEVLVVLTLTMLCRIHTWLGDLPVALEHGREASALARRADGWFAALAPAVHAQARLAAGEADGCVDAVLTACGGPDLPAIDPGSRPDWYELLTRAAVAAGDLEDASGWAKRAATAVEDVDLPAGAGFASLAAAHVALAAGRPAAAAADALAAAGRFDATGNRTDALRARLVAGIAADEPDLLRRVVRDAAECSAAAIERQARQALDRFDRPRAASRPAGPLARLTRREREVADLVAAGHTNRRIAEELFLSVKTVERHLARIFAKLEITARSRLAAMVAGERA